MNLSISEKTLFYSPFSFLLDRTKESSAEDFINELNVDIQQGKIECFNMDGIGIYFRKLNWDSKFFGIPTFRIDYINMSANIPFNTIKLAFTKLREHLSSRFKEYYLFADVPSEDTPVIKGMCGAGWHLIETRITNFMDDLQNYNYPFRSSIRNATEADIQELRHAAMNTINIYDRFHADDFFTEQEAHDFLGVFVENSVKGFAEEIIVPADGPANAFMTGIRLKASPLLANRKIGKMVVSAVAPARQGWYIQLLSEMCFRFKERGLDTAIMTTQSTNRAVLKVWHKLGSRFGRCTHIFSTYHRI